MKSLEKKIRFYKTEEVVFKVLCLTIILGLLVFTVASMRGGVKEASLWWVELFNRYL